MQRLILAATLGANYGIYGPAFELCENVPATPGQRRVSEQRKVRDPPLGPDCEPHSLAPLITQVNQIRRDNPALQSDWLAALSRRR